MSALRNFSIRQTPQSEPVAGRNDQVQNNAGGFGFNVTPIQRLRRFLVLGTDGGSYYQSERDLTRENAQFIIDLLTADASTAELNAKWIVDEAVEVSQAGRAPKNDQALFVMALCASFGSDEGKRYAMERLPEVARIGTHLFQFVEFMTQFRGWGRVAREGVASWYQTQDAKSLAYDVTKYPRRGAWGHRDLLRVSHPEPASQSHAIVADFVTHGYNSALALGVRDESEREVLAYLAATEDVKRQDDVAGVIDLIREYRLPREVVPLEYMKDPAVWEAMLESGMPMGALIRNLGRMTSLGVINPMGKWAAQIAERLRTPEAIKGSRVHPLNILVALLTYRSGGGFLGSLTWSPVREIVDALDAAFYLAFGNVEDSGQRTMLAIDVSGSMGSRTSMTPLLDCRTAAAAMALVTANVESRWMAVAFSGDGAGASADLNGHVSGRGFYAGVHSAISEIDVSPRQRLDDVVKYMDGLDFGATDCALPMLYAIQRDLEIDTFVIYTDNESWLGKVHPFQALRMYREHSGINARLVSVAMTAGSFSVADPRDPGMLDLVGFDTSTPRIITEFSLGRI